jgi:predicted pyridoxine 5'-phosphate oxidase superfamily flavin-nucleotide-binding protein
VTDTFRVNGRATLTTDEALLEPSTVSDKRPLLGILIDIEQAYTHCSKAFLRSDCWNPERFLTPEDLPSNGALACFMSGGAIDASTYDAERAARYARREGFY